MSLDFVCGQYANRRPYAVANIKLRSGRPFAFSSQVVRAEMRKLRASCAQNMKRNDFRREVSVGFLLNSCDERGHACDSVQSTDNRKLAGYCEWGSRAVS